MELFIDSVISNEIKDALNSGIIFGVTTTPTFMVRDGVSDIDKHILDICSITPGEVHIEALGNTAEEIIKESKRLHKLNEKLVMKIPVDWNGLKAVSELSKKEIKTNVHLVYSLNQAVLAAKAGATYVCILLGRLHDIGHDPIELIHRVKHVFNQYRIETKIMAASIRTPDHVKQSFIAGADAVTIPYNIFESLLEHTLTKKGIDAFILDNKKSLWVAKDFITRNPLINVSKSLHEAIQIMTDNKTGAISILNNENKIVGIITEGDLRRALLDENVREKTIKDIMSKNPKVIHQHAKLDEIISIFIKFKINQLIVVDERNCPLGIIIWQDLFREGIVSNLEHE